MKSIYATQGNTFKASDYAGHGGAWNAYYGPIGLSRGGNNMDNRLLSQFGRSYVETGMGFGPVGWGSLAKPLHSGYGVMRSYGYTWLLK